MKALKELAFVVDPEELEKKIQKLLFFKEDGLLNQLYLGVINGDFTSDEEAHELLYPDESSTRNYRKLKFTLKNRLKEAVLLFDEKSHSNSAYLKAYYQSYKEWALVKILLGRNARNAAIEISQNILKKADKFEFVDLGMEVSSVLRTHYGSRMGDKKKFEEYRELFRKYRHLYFLEEEAKDAYTDLIINYVNNRSPKADQHQKALEALGKLDQMADGKNDDVYRYQLFRYLIELMSTTTIYDYEATLEICDRALDYFENKDFETHLALQIIYYQQLVCFIQLGDFEQGETVAEKYLAYIPEGSFNWFKYKELYVLFAIHTEEYDKAAAQYFATTEHEQFQFLPDAIKEIWKIFFANLYFLAINDLIGQPHFTARIKDGFKLGKFINEMAIFSKDKSGLNASVLIIQLAILIAEGRYEETIDKTEAAQQYGYRYLNTEYTRRIYLFLKLLLKLPQLGYDKEEVIIKQEGILKQLRDTPLEVASQDTELEIIPFEKLWETLLSSLSS